MLDLSLDALTQGRDGVTIYSVELRRVTPEVVTAEQLANAGLEMMAEGRVFGLPAEPHGGATYFSASVSEGKDADEKPRDVWLVNWDRMPSADVPPEILENAVESLFERLKAFWAGQAEPASVSLQVHYSVAGHELMLDEPQPRELGPYKVKPRAVFWGVEGAKHLTAVSPIPRKDKSATLIAIGSFSSVAFPKLEELELALWEDVRNLLKRAS